MVVVVITVAAVAVAVMVVVVVVVVAGVGAGVVVGVGAGAAAAIVVRPAVAPRETIPLFPFKLLELLQEFEPLIPNHYACGSLMLL